ncbi:Aste57867_12282 [Aphanomyces stellatus]|uniref:Aste57867_12282 protein n=1 Tax=Aphanomyces stellatus TaxID=120398 RepID=A0A485KV41_9STRA|nr:hypothetical protein As57867_012237 [Aphanomyces stellatus]VFT89135.1 Aste57867_12282 [Aphanomyces stellatus]
MTKRSDRSGELTLTVLEARDLKRTQLFGLQHPFCVVRVDRQEKTTEVHVDGDATPFWNALFVFRIDRSTSVEIVILTSSSLCVPITIGSVSIPIDLNAWRDRDLREEWLPVQRKAAFSSTMKPQGELRVRMEFKLDSTLHKHPSVIKLPTRSIDKATPELNAIAEDGAAASPPSPAAKSPRPMSPSRLAGPMWAHVPDLKAFDRLFIAPTMLVGGSDPLHPNRLQKVVYDHGPVYMQHDMHADLLVTALQVSPALPQTPHHLLRLLGFTFLDAQWCGVFEYSPPLQWQPHWTREKLDIAVDVAHAMVQLHVAKQQHGQIQLAHVYRDHVKAKLLSFPRQIPLEEMPVPWAAPEVVDAAARTSKMDVFAFGIFLLELDKGHVPFHEERQAWTRGEFLAKVGDLSIESQLSSDCPPPLVALIQKCLAVNPAVRPTSLVVLDRLREIIAADTSPSTHGDNTV